MTSSNRVAVVTGASRGIGRAIALALADDGYDVVANYRRDEAAALEVQAEVERRGRRCAAVQASVADDDGCDHLADAALETFGRVDVLVNNAGNASRGNHVVDTDAGELATVVRTHALGPHRLCRRLLPAMRLQERSDIVFISSTATLHHLPGSAPYNMAKAAAEALAVTLAKEERPHGVHVNVVAPGLVETDMGRRLAAATEGVTDMRQLDSSQPFGRVCQPDDVADVVRWLVSPGAGYLTGERINVHGGGEEGRW